MLRIQSVAIQCCAEVGRIAELVARKDGALADQLRRAMASVALNISEGSGSQARTGTRDTSTRSGARGKWAPRSKSPWRSATCARSMRGSLQRSIISAGRCIGSCIADATARRRHSGCCCAAPRAAEFAPHRQSRPPMSRLAASRAAHRASRPAPFASLRALPPSAATSCASRDHALQLAARPFHIAARVPRLASAIPGAPQRLGVGG